MVAPLTVAGFASIVNSAFFGTSKFLYMPSMRSHTYFAGRTVGVPPPMKIVSTE